MRICLLSYEYPPTIGGEASYTEGLARFLSLQGHEVVVLTSGNVSGKIDELDEGPRVVRLRTSGHRPLRIASFQALSSLYLSRHDFEIVHQTNDYLFPLPSRTRVDVATVHHPYGAEERAVRGMLGPRDASEYLRSRNMGYLRSMQALASRRVGELISVSRYTARSLARELGIPPDRFHVCPNGVDMLEFEDGVSREEAASDLGFDGPTLLHVGRLDFNKDLHTLVRAFREVADCEPEARLLIVGNGPLEKGLRSLVSGAGLAGRVRLLGSLPRRKLIETYLASDVVLLSSLMEGFGIVLVEGMAAGRPCIATRCGGTAEVIEEGVTGRTVPVRDAGAMSRAILEVISEPTLARRYGRAGRRRVERLFDLSEIVRRTADVYRTIGNR